MSLVASCPSFLHVVPRNVAVQRIGGKGHQSTPIMIKLHLYANTSHLPTGNSVHCTAAHSTAQRRSGLSHSINHTSTMNSLCDVLRSNIMSVLPPPL